MPTNDTTPLPQRVKASYSNLSTAAKDLNAVSDELGSLVGQIDTALKKLNLGVTEWVKIAERGADPANSDFWEESDHVGYAKKNGKWGICLRTVGEDIQNPADSSDEQWLFSDAPRSLRLLAIDKIPDLLEALAEKSVQTKNDIEAKLGEVRDVADAVTAASGGRIPIRRVTVATTTEASK
jgi:hypothetical protein